MIEQVRNTLRPQGKLARSCPGYEFRQEQLDMAEAVARALECKGHLLVEAGTGVGKTVAYLAPAILHALGGKPVIVSTHTINLQGQLVNKDIPLMREVMDDHPFSAVLMKGRANFVCLKEVDHASESFIYSEDPNFVRLREWLSQTKTGDVAELDFVFPDWHEVCSNPDTCRGKECQYHSEKCFYYAMRKRAAAADIVVVNHALFLSDLAVRTLDPKNAILPNYCAVIFDEAHHLEDVATDSFGIEFTNYRIPFFLNRLRKRRDIAITQTEYQMIQEANDVFFDSFARLDKQEFFLEELFRHFDKAILYERVGGLLTLLESLDTQLVEQDTEGNEELKERIDGYRKMLFRIRAELAAVVGVQCASANTYSDEQPNWFRWCEKQSGGRFVTCCLHLSPISIAHILSESLWEYVDSVICTSATLSDSGGFGYMRSRLGAPECDELVLGSPFDFQRQALLYVPDDLEAPSDKPEYADAIADRIRELLLASNGRAFLLFTSYRMLNAVFARLVNQVPFRLLRQGEMSNDRLIREFREDESTCLMGVHSFWEGVDVKGERLSCVIIDKLPFAVPDNPTHKARCDEIEHRGGNWFRDYAIPQAQIRLKQGFGRLIRTKTDRGVVAILDSRIHTKYYGKEFLRYLPRCKYTKSLNEVRSFLRTDEHLDVERLTISE